MSFYTGATVSKEFTKRWRSKKHVANAAPWAQVLVRRGRFERSYHWDWPNPQFGQIIGRSIRRQWYPDWTPLEDWRELPGVSKIDLDQSFDRNGITVATLDVDNVTWTEAHGVGGKLYHVRQRGYLWPWRGWAPTNRPSTGQGRTEWFNTLSNAQILIRQGYGESTAVKTFTGLIDNYAPTVRPDEMSIVARDFGGVLVDTHIFGWNKEKSMNAPFAFVPHNWKKLGLLKSKAARYVIVKDATDIVRCALRWCGFKEWEIEDSGVDLKTPMQVDSSMTWADVINDVATQLGYIFFIAEPSNNDLSIGRPIFRPSSSVLPARSKPITIRDSDLLTDLKPVHDNSEDRYIIRVRGRLLSKKKGGKPLAGDPARVTFCYWPPWMGMFRGDGSVRAGMSGVIKQLTMYNIGDNHSVGFQTEQDCMVAAVLIAIQIALKRDTGTLQAPGNPALGLDGFAYITDAGTGVNSRLYITNRKSTMALGGESGSGGELRWATELGGSLVDNPEWEHLTKDYYKATHGQTVVSWGTPV